MFCFTFFSVFANSRGPEKSGPRQTYKDGEGSCKVCLVSVNPLFLSGLKKKIMTCLELMGTFLYPHETQVL